MEILAWLDTYLRIGAFIGVFLLMAGLETAFPRRGRVKPREQRWLANFGMLGVSRALLWMCIPATTTMIAWQVQKLGFGVFNWIPLPGWIEIILAVILLDLAIWAQHLAMHHVPFLWAIHKVHHADEDLDASSGIRFHPLEQVISAVFKILIVVCLGADPLAVVLFEVLLNASAMFNHASVKLPLNMDAQLRKVIVTPDFHRVHHSVHMPETNSNFGFCLSVWDQLFHTYTPQPRDGHEKMQIGLDERPGGNTASLWWGLTAPFRQSD